MHYLQKLNQISFPTIFAISCFILGTILFIFYMVFPDDNLLLIGVMYVAAAVVLNLVILISLVYQLITIPFERTAIVVRILILLSNIPIAIMYYNAVYNAYKS